MGEFDTITLGLLGYSESRLDPSTSWVRVGHSVPCATHADCILHWTDRPGVSKIGIDDSYRVQFPTTTAVGGHKTGWAIENTDASLHCSQPSERGWWRRFVPADLSATPTLPSSLITDITTVLFSNRFAIYVDVQVVFAVVLITLCFMSIDCVPIFYEPWTNADYQCEMFHNSHAKSFASLRIPRLMWKSLGTIGLNIRVLFHCTVPAVVRHEQVVRWSDFRCMFSLFPVYCCANN